MKKINFTRDVFPHLISVAVFLVVTVFFFNPVFFENKVIEQGDIQQFRGTSKAITDYREDTGEEALWTNSVFSGMPAYLISVQWSNAGVVFMKQVLTLWLPHPVSNIFLAFIAGYILLLAFGIRPYLAMAGAIAFGLSTYMIVGISAGHNSRIGAIALIPMVMAGIHLCFSARRVLGIGVFVAGLALHLRENHLQVTYYLLIIVAFYGLFRLFEFVREKKLVAFAKSTALLVPAALLAAGTFFGQFWAITEYTSYSTRGKTELVKEGVAPRESGLTKDYAFQYKYGILEPMTLLIPEFYGGGSGRFFVQDRESATFQALASSGDQQMVNQLANYTSAYWGPQGATLAPYYAGAIMIFLFVAGIAFADRRYRWWLIAISVLSIMMSWGDSFKAFNYFLFDHLPGYNKFRSHSFALAIVLFAIPLLGMLGLERILQDGLGKQGKKKLLVAFGICGGLCLIILLFAGMFPFTRDIEEGLPAWFLNALADDRKGLMQSDAFRSLAFIASIFILLYLEVHKKISPIGFYAFLTFMITVDLAVVNKRYFTEENYRRERDHSFFALTEADREILKDPAYYRVYNLNGAFLEARTSYYHHSIGGYHGAKLRRYQDLYDSCLISETRKLYADAQSQQLNFDQYTTMNMLNIRYIVFGGQRENIIFNPDAYGNTWFVDEVVRVNSANEELAQTCSSASGHVAVVDISKFTVDDVSTDSAAAITLTAYGINTLKYESRSQVDGLAVFSEIYYPKGWVATIDGKEVPVLRANYVLRALEVPAGEHTIEFRFEPQPYQVGNKITMASSWLAFLTVLACVGWSLRKDEDPPNH